MGGRLHREDPVDVGDGTDARLVFNGDRDTHEGDFLLVDDGSRQLYILCMSAYDGSQQGEDEEYSFHKDCVDGFIRL